MNNAVFGKTLENIRKHRDIKLVTTDKKRNKFVSEPNYHRINYISEDLSIIEMNKTKVKMNKPIYLGLSILDISKILIDCNWIRIHNHLVHKRTLNHLAKCSFMNWPSVCL